MKKYNFRVLKPCANCPFRTDKPTQKGWLGEERAREISDAILKENKTFTCHKTLNKKAHSHCAGALILLKHDRKNSKFGNAMIQIAERIGLYEPDKLEGDDVCFHTQEDFINWHK